MQGMFTMKKTYAELRRQTGAKPEPRSETQRELYRRDVRERERRANAVRRPLTTSRQKRTWSTSQNSKPTA